MKEFDTSNPQIQLIYMTMGTFKHEQLLSRSRSTGFLDKIENEFDFKCFSARFCGYNGSDNPHASVSSVEPCFACDGTCSMEETKLDSGLSKSLADGEMLLVLEHKIDKMSEILQEQQSFLMSIKEKIMNSKAEEDHTLDTGKKYVEEDSKAEELISNETIKIEASSDTEDEASAARSLLEAIEVKQDVTLDHIIRVALENFLQSDGVTEHVAAAAAACVRGAVRGNFCRALSSGYLPLVQRSHRRLLAHVTKLLEHSFADLEESTASWFKVIHRASRTIRSSLEKHQILLEGLSATHTQPDNDTKLLRDTLKSVLEEELRSWRVRVVQELAQCLEGVDGGDSEADLPDPPYDCGDFAPASPMQPANPDSSIIDTLMRCAVIKKHIEDGDVSGAFEEALSSGDLALVVAACRAAPPAAARALRPAARLALLQQLATDMVHDTQLKCRYLEEALLSLAQCPAAREHLPRVAREAGGHLARFLRAYPKHHAARRVALILMAANNFK